MNAYTIVAIALIAAGVLALVYGGFSYTKDSESADLGPISLTITEKQAVNIPVWAGAGSTALGAALLVYGVTKK